MPIFSLELAKCKSLIKFNNQPKVPIGQSLGPNPPQPEPQLQTYELIKQVSKCNGCRFLFDKIDKKLNILGRNELEWYEKIATTTKQYKIGQKNTCCCAKRGCILIRRPHLDTK